MPTSATPLTRAFGLVLRDMRTAAGLSQEALGYRAKLSRNYVSELELGRKAPTLAAVEALATAVGVAPHLMVKAAEDRSGSRSG